MKKLWLFLVAFIIVLGLSVVTNITIKNNITNNIDKLKYFNDHDKNYSDFIMAKTITENDIVVMGSSELIPYSIDVNEFTHPECLFNEGKSDYNTILYGRGYTQSLQHAIDIGALQNNLKNNKVVLILSPQWFTKEPIMGQFFTRNFYDNQYIEFLQNDNISIETKKLISSRVDEMMKDYQSNYERVKMYEDVYVNGSKNPLSILMTTTFKYYNEIKNNYILWNNYLKDRKVEYRDEYVHIDNIDFDSLLIEAESTGREECTNNEYGIVNDSFTKNISSRYEKLKESETDKSYAESEEYNDFELFLKVCNELDIEPLIVSVPVNGFWYDYTGFPKDGREIYYEKIRQICNKYNAELADFSNKEYEKYFLRDTMHLGWKGWVYVNKAIYEFYKQ